MDLISREAAIKFAKEQMIKGIGAYSKGRNAAMFIMKSALNNPNVIPTVPAVPLDELCLLLHDIAGSPCYTQPGEDMCNQLIGGQCNPEWSDEECWKRFLTKWMEENDASISSR